MSDLLVATHLTQIEEALQQEILLAYGRRLTVANLTALRALESAPRNHNELAYCTSPALTYKFNRFLTTADNGTTVIAPTDAPTAGRWQRTASAVSTGYLRAVELYSGESTGEEIVKRLAGARPGVVIVFDGETLAPKSGMAGTLYASEMDFNLWCVSSNFRGEYQATIGSAVSAEASATADPGANRIVGDLMKQLAGSTLSDQEGVKYIEVARAPRESVSL